MASFPTVPYIVPGVPNWQYMGAGEGSISGSFTSTSSTASEIYDVGQNSLNLFIRTILGYAFWGGAPYRIDRVLPKRHPQFYDLWASRVTINGGVAPNRPSRVRYAGVTAWWKLIRVTVTYETPPYSIFSPAVGMARADFREWARFTTLDAKPSTEFIQRKQGAFVFDDAAPNVGGRTIEGGTVQIINKVRLIWTWYQVPDAYLFGANGFDGGGTALNITKCLGKVNDSLWHGYPKGTLLLESYELIPHSMPALAINAGGQVVASRSWDVKFNMVYFTNPADRAVYGATAFTAGGHNFVPHPTNGKWYLAAQQPAGARPFLPPPGVNTSPEFLRYQEINFDIMWAGNTGA